MATALVLLLSAFLSAMTVQSLGINNGLARTPPMGWNPYNAFRCDTTEDEYRAAADALVKLGLKDRGYRYLNMDCGWQSTERSTSNLMLSNTTKIPSGIEILSEYVTSQGLLFGIYSDAGYYSCDQVGGREQWLGSNGYEANDIYMFGIWGATYLKYDNCFVVSNTDFVDFNPSIDEEQLFSTMTDAIDGTDMVYSISDWGIQDPARWTSNVAHSWRIANDIQPSFEDLKRIINQVVPITKFAGPGGWNDLDLLVVGDDNLTEAEWKMHFTFWAAAKSPLLISTDLTRISQSALDILSNTALIAVNQDSLGQSIAFKRRYTDDHDIWTGNLSDASMVMLILNWKNTTRAITFDLVDVGLSSADMTDLWNGADMGTVSGPITATVEAHGALVYRLADRVAAQTASSDFKSYRASAYQNVLAGGASPRNVNASVVTVVGHIGGGNHGTLTIVGVDGGTHGGSLLTRVTYINGDYTFVNTDCSNCRRVEVSVNEGQPVVAEMPISAMSWDVLSEPYLLTLDGFHPGAQNNITFGNPTGAWAPDIYLIEVQAR